MRAGELWRRLERLWNRDAHARELEEEMRIHVEMRAERLRSDAQRTGALASSLARQKFGNEVSLQQRSRYEWGFVRFNELLSDVRFAMRRIRLQRGVSLTVVAVMGIGIGTTTAIFSAVDATMLRPLPFPRAYQLMQLPFQVRSSGLERVAGDVDFEAIVEMKDLFSHVAAYGVGGLNLDDGNAPRRLRVGVVTTGFFHTMGVLPSIGRTFTDYEGKTDGADVAIISNGLWKSSFGGRPLANIRITLNKRRYAVVGVMPEGFAFPELSDIWIPLTVPITAASLEPFRDFVRHSVVARVADSVTTSQASMQLLARIEASPGGRFPRHPEDNVPWGAQMRRNGGVGEPLQGALAGDRKNAFYLLFGATTMLLLTACANVSNLLLIQARARRREIAVRHVLGATPGRVFRQLLTESVLLSCTGALLGMVIAVTAMQPLRFMIPAAMAGIVSVDINVRMLLFSIILAVGAGVTFGLWPAAGNARRNTSDAIKNSDGYSSAGRGTFGLRRTLVGAEIAVAVMLLIGAGVLMKSFEKIVTRELGIQTENVGTLEIAFASSFSPTLRLSILNEITSRLQSTPSVIAAGAAKSLPLSTSGLTSIGIKVPGANVRSDHPEGFTGVSYEDASGGYFKALNIRLIDGRYFSTNDDSKQSRVAIVSESVARKFWSGVSPVGRTLYALPGDTLTVVGVVADVVGRIDLKAQDQIYRPLGSNTPMIATVVARGTMSSSLLLKQMLDAVGNINSSQPVFNLRSMEDVRDASVGSRRTSAWLLTLFAAVALFLASLGIFIVVSSNLSLRQRELGVRSALGATGSNLLALVSGEMAWVTLAGTGLGVAGAWMLASVLQHQVYEIDVRDTATFVTVPLVLLVIAGLATLIPASRAFHVNPAEIIRSD